MRESTVLYSEYVRDQALGVLYSMRIATVARSPDAVQDEGNVTHIIHILCSLSTAIQITDSKIVEHPSVITGSLIYSVHRNDHGFFITVGEPPEDSK